MLFKRRGSRKIGGRRCGDKRRVGGTRRRMGGSRRRVGGSRRRMGGRRGRPCKHTKCPPCPR